VAVVARVVRDFGGLRVATIDWPLALIEMPEQRVNDADLEAALVYFEQLMVECQRNHERFARVTDLANVRQPLTASQRRLFGHWLQRGAELQKATSVGEANVTPSPIVRGIITAIYWFQKPLVPTMFFSTRGEATLQAIRWLEDARVSLPPGVCHLRDDLRSAARRDGHAPARP
jgi:hypothetical protein